MNGVAELNQANGDVDTYRAVTSQHVNALLRESKHDGHDLAGLVESTFAEVMNNPDPLSYEPQPEIAEGTYVGSKMFQMQSLSPGGQYRVCFLRRLSQHDYPVVVWDDAAAGDSCAQPLKAKIYLSYKCRTFEEALLWYFKALEHVRRKDPKY